MLSKSTPLLLLSLLAVSALILVSCGNKKSFAPKKKKTQKIVGYEIHQPDSSYGNDDVLIWKETTRDNRAFKLPPGTKVEVLKTVDTKEGKTMYQIKDGDERTGWVPKSHCKAIYK